MCAYVYFVRHAKEPRFKIGKSRDIHKRLSQLGKPGDLDLEGSHCIRLPTDEDAFRCKDALLKLLAYCNIEYDEKRRFDGDTEFFRIEAYDEAINFVDANPKFFCGASVQPIPAPPARPEKTPEERLRAREERKRKHEAQQYESAMFHAGAVIDCLKKMGLKAFELCAGAQPYVVIEADEYELFATAVAKLNVMQLYEFYVDKARTTKSTVLLRATPEQYAPGRWRATALIGTPVTDSNRASLDPGYVRTIDMFPRPQVPRKTVVFHDPAAVFLF